MNLIYEFILNCDLMTMFKNLFCFQRSRIEYIRREDSRSDNSLSESIIPSAKHYILDEAQSDIPKEKIANVLHQQSGRKSKIFTFVFCANNDNVFHTNIYQVMSFIWRHIFLITMANVQMSSILILDKRMTSLMDKVFGSKFPLYYRKSETALKTWKI